jgi:hypothetical protein
MKFRKKPVVIEAFCIGRDNEPEWWKEADRAGKIAVHPPHHWFIQTFEGTIRADLGDWIVRGVEGEIYPVKDRIFGATYEPAP